jgi:S1-C subfamily serine protease
MRRFIAFALICVSLMFHSCTGVSSDHVTVVEVTNKFENMTNSVAMIVDPSTIKSDIMGSGIVFDKDHIVTCYHVVKGLVYVPVMFHNDATIYKGKVIAAVRSKDVAVIKIENPPSYIRPVTFESNNNISMGKKIYILGHPMGMSYSLSTGVISALRSQHEVKDHVYDSVQVDAAINPGNSGGAMFSEDGHLVGMACFIYTRSGMSHGINFGIVVHELKKAYYDALHAVDTEDILRDKELQLVHSIHYLLSLPTHIIKSIPEHKLKLDNYSPIFENNK